jgi:uncharacterized membrane protein
MFVVEPWISATATIGLLIVYELYLALAQHRWPQRHARTTHAQLREEWFNAVSNEKGTEVLAVQTIRNSLMSASMLASTAALGLMGSATIVFSTLRGQIETLNIAHGRFGPQIALELGLLGLLFVSLVTSTMAVRYFNHASFVSAMPVGSEARVRWAPLGVAYLRRAGILYGIALRQLILIAPIVVSLVHPMAGPIAALIVVAVLIGFDRVAR